jgi:tRNA C32,U32 (ribose-2'-O)-methylase TrmJ
LRWRALAPITKCAPCKNYVYNTTTQFEQSSNEIASFDELEGFYAHLAQALEHIGYFKENSINTWG